MISVLTCTPLGSVQDTNDLDVAVVGSILQISVTAFVATVLDEPLDPISIAVGCRVVDVRLGAKLLAGLACF